MRLTLYVTVACLALPAVGQERALTGDEFAALVKGKTMDTYDETGLFGVETFLPGRRTLWRNSDVCLKGTWTETDGIICYTYEDDTSGPYCRSFYDRGGWLMGFENDIRGNNPIMLYPSDDVVTCDDFLGS
jgi:hypothetical protein